MPLKDRIQQAVKDAMRSGDKRRLGTARLITAAIKQREVDERIELDDEQIVLVLDKMCKQRRESLEQYRKANREDLAEQEEYELGVLKEFLPEPLSEAEIDALIDAAVTDTGAAGIKDMGKVMGILKPQLQGRADMGAVSARIKARLGG
ncbi:MAG: GatB/YqeY domain-containing protein [Gammaproteobacteria bacterium]|nr:GatB/YqeY domain-containing protein [Gammaproteobacteria bacterium]MCW9057835.1 GatB/YqeY domain-containing protein [Gammaproteobacteria bacterium]